MDPELLYEIKPEQIYKSWNARASAYVLMLFSVIERGWRSVTELNYWIFTVSSSLYHSSSSSLALNFLSIISP